MVDVNVDENQEDSGSEERFEEQAPETVAIPEGFDARLFNEQGLFNPETAKEYFDEQKKEFDKVAKQRDDFQKVISSKGQVPANIDEYFTNYKNEKYDSLKTNETVLESMKGLATTFKDIGLSPKQADKVYDRFFETFEKSGAIDARSPEAITEQQKAWETSEREKLGASAEEVIGKVDSFISTSPILDAEERAMLVSLINSTNGGAKMIKALNKMIVMGGSGAEGSIPAGDGDGGSLPDDESLRAEYQASTTTQARKDEIQIARRKAGRTHSLFLMGDVVKGGR